MIASFGSPPAHKSTPDQRAPSALSGLPVAAAAARATTHPLMATCSRAQLPPPPAPILAAGLTDPGMKGGRPVSAPEEEEVEEVKPPAADMARPGKRFRPRVPMTKEEEEKLIEVTVRHMSGRKELQARIERRDELRKRLDELLFMRRSWAATLANQVFAHRARVAQARHQLRVGWKEGEPLPEEIDDALRCAFVMNEHIVKGMDMGLDAFIDDYRKFYENEKMRSKVEAEIVCSDENGAPQGPVASK
ncbi:hypothetical protein C2845_PM15G20670 [Panicum miliaceum]|uniref:Uncharacterized protein n=1 Tax=Panicum miliaceum TaxID=4540 RepID=A0A3L6Q956_PANMI|nr:hypothetical protein C2845_PM15G20670 [Panicum miliaceum]